jgi:hypothetical protein
MESPKAPKGLPVVGVRGVHSALETVLELRITGRLVPHGPGKISRVGEVQ